MDARRQTALHQQQRARKLAASTDVDTFASLLSRPDLLDCIEALLPHHREQQKGDRFEWHLLSPLGVTAPLDFCASRLACSRQ